MERVDEMLGLDWAVRIISVGKGPAERRREHDSRRVHIPLHVVSLERGE